MGVYSKFSVQYLWVKGIPGNIKSPISQYWSWLAGNIMDYAGAPQSRACESGGDCGWIFRERSHSSDYWVLTIRSLLDLSSVFRISTTVGTEVCLSIALGIFHAGPSRLSSSVPCRLVRERRLLARLAREGQLLHAFITFLIANRASTIPQKTWRHL